MSDDIDNLEVALRALRPRAVPPSWRQEILAECAAAPRPSRAVRLLFWFRPGPVPACALAGLWLVILGFSLDTPLSPPAVPGHVDAASARAAREERQTLLARLNESPHGDVVFSVRLHPGG